MTLKVPAHPVTVDDIPIGGKILAVGVSHDDFMAGYDGMRVEWVNGVVIEMASIGDRHDALNRFLENMLEYLLELTGGGRVCQDPMVMKIPGVSSRAPDLLVLLPEHVDRLQTNIVIGAADLVIEIVSPGSWRTDSVEKFREYETGGVPEYWILDPEYQTAFFYQLNPVTKQYERIAPVEGIYQSKMLPKLRLNVAWLWRDPLPGVAERIELVKAMLAEAQ